MTTLEDEKNELLGMYEVRLVIAYFLLMFLFLLVTCGLSVFIACRTRPGYSRV